MTDPSFLFPDNPFDYVSLIRRPRGMGRIPEDKAGTKIAIVGAGCAGLCAAWELMKIGLHPVIYEADQNPGGSPRIGGRAYTYRFPGDPKALAELGAMRIPPVHRTVCGYMDQFGIDYGTPFPNPLVVPTTLYFKGKKYFIPVGGPLPGPIQKAAHAWKKLITPLVETWASARPDQRARQWQDHVEQFKDTSFYEILKKHGFSKTDIDLFGSLGIGTGGFDSMFPISFLEIFRLAALGWETGQRLVKGGVGQIPESFWNTPCPCRHFGNTSVSALNKGQPLGAVTQIQTRPGKKIAVTDIRGHTASYEAVILTCSHRALETGIKINRDAFSEEVWTAIRNIHMIQSGKIFIRTREAFWKDLPPESTLNCTITDEAVRGTYFFDFEDTKSGVICLSYTWEDSAVKLHGLEERELLDKSLDILKTIYGRDLISDQVEEVKTIFWERGKGYHGAFKLNYPGQYEDQKALFLQSRPKSHETANGVFLGGESASFAGGWIEGALQSGLDAAMAVVCKLGGKIFTN